MARPATTRLEVRFDRAPGDSRLFGALAEQDHRIYFEYDPDWLTTGLQLSPFTLPARSGLIEHTDREFGPLFGLFDDSLPDGWGRLLMDRHFRRLGLEPPTLSPLQRLAFLGTDTMGALTYHPPAKREGAATAELDLQRLARQAQAVFAGETADVLPELLAAGGSPGGARPKVLVGWNPDTDEIISGEADLPDGYEHWIVKFCAREDTDDAGLVEYAYSKMARWAGLEMPATRLFETRDGERYFGVKRFDRAEGNRRRHVHTFGNLIHADFRLPSCDYADLLKATTILTRDRREVISAFRLAAFNVRAHNRDDHAKNFAFMLDDETGLWRLSPAYDLTFALGPGGEHTTTVVGEGKAPAGEHLLGLAAEFDIDQAEARAVLDQVFAAVDRWDEAVGASGVPREASRRISEYLQRPSILH